MSSPIVTRAQAGIPEPTGRSTNIDGSEGVTGHYGGPSPWTGPAIDRSSTAAFEATAPHARCVSIWRAWDAFHRSKGWVAVAYNYGACPHGFIFEGRGAGVRSAAQGTNAGNQHSHAVCYIAGDGDPLTTPARVAWLDARDLCRNGPRPANDKLHPHHYWHSTACPGHDLDQWLAAGAIRPALAWTPPPQPKMAAPLAAIADTPTGGGYIEVDELGGVYCFGDAMFFGSLPGLGVVPNYPIVACEISPSGGGYWLVAADGGVFAFGDAGYHGGMGGTPLNAPVRAFAATPTGGGYRLAGRDGGIFAFGDAGYLGSAAA